jgi:hypothetical protein
MPRKQLEDIWFGKKKENSCLVPLCLIFYTLYNSPIAQSRQNHIVIPFTRLSPVKPALTPHAPAIRTHHETSIKPLYLFYLTPVATCRRYQRHRRQICHRYQRHRRQILPPFPLVLLTPVANLPPVSLTPVVHLDTGGK